MPQSDQGQSSARGAFFGRRKGRPLRSRQSELFATLLPRVALDLAAPPPPDLRVLFEPSAAEVRLEIGFGGGEHLLGQAAMQPRVGFIGCEAFVNAVAKVLTGIEASAYRNVRIHFGDAMDLLHWLPDAAVAGVDLLYPDPWPKRRHWKRRFVQDHTVALLARILRRGGELRFATDIEDYAAWTLVRFLRTPEFVWTAERAEDWRRPWPQHLGTRYEAKSLRQGRVPTYLVFRRR